MSVCWPPFDSYYLIIIFYTMGYFDRLPQNRKMTKYVSTLSNNSDLSSTKSIKNFWAVLPPCRSFSLVGGKSPNTHKDVFFVFLFVCLFF